jgi:hypothetical protein
MQTCTRCYTQSPDEADHCVKCQADLRQFSTTAVALQKYQANPRVIYVRIQVNDDCCPACQEAYGAYPKDAVPRLPIEGCSHDLGCRCFYQPFLSEIFP